MKSTIYKLFSTLIIVLLAFSAQAVSIETGEYERGDEKRPGIRVYLDASPDEVRDAYIDFLKDKYDFKLKGDGLFANKDELYAEEIMVQEIIDKKVNWYAEIIETDNSQEKTRMTIFVNLGYDVYLSEDQYGAAFAKVYAGVTDFVKMYVPEYYEELIEDAKKEIEDLEEDTSDLKNDIEKNHKDIKKLKAEIEEMEATVNENENRLEKMKTDLEREEESFKKAKKEISKIK
jgi:hypothetical protein